MPTPDRTTALKRGMKGHCPRCDCRDIYVSHWRLRDRCPKCGLPLELEDGWSYGSVPLAYGLAGFGWVLPIFVLAVFGVIDPIPAALIGFAGVVILPLATFRFTKSLWVGVYYSLIHNEMGQRDATGKGDHHG
ncbi:MAG: DUF983 domain-containing protein [Verrucomicrobiota bacterium JB022]|nr:DUF983 domain-containing protein [Verrucomicrobiota bacterium JB022]